MTVVAIVYPALAYLLALDARVSLGYTVAVRDASAALLREVK